MWEIIYGIRYSKYHRGEGTSLGLTTLWFKTTGFIQKTDYMYDQNTTILVFLNFYRR